MYPGTGACIHNVYPGASAWVRITVFIRLVRARTIRNPEAENRKSESKSVGGHMGKTKKQGENSACTTLFDYVYYYMVVV